MTTIAAVDIGSNGIRLAIGRLLDDQIPHIVETRREAIRLGQDVFSGGGIEEETIERAQQAFDNFKSLIDTYEAHPVRAIGTSALREATNQDLFIDRIFQNSGIKIEVVSAEEEARLVNLAISQVLDLRGKRAMLIDIGGGSVEIVLSQDAQIERTESLKLGTVRLLELLKNQDGSVELFSQLTTDYVQRTEKWFGNLVANQKLDLCIGVGGNVEELGKLRCSQLNKDSNGELFEDELTALLRILETMTYEERIEKLAMRPDRADVIIPAAIVLKSLMSQASINRLVIPKVGVRDGVLLDIADNVNQKGTQSQRDGILNAALHVGRRYQFDEAHGRAVAKFAVSLFDQMLDLHRLDEESRTILEVASLLHDIGRYIRNSGHHKHTQYLLRETPIMGLNESQLARVATIARYHRKAKPSLRHEPYKALQRSSRIEVSKLAAILRIATALDIEQNGKVSQIEVEQDGSNLRLQIAGEGDLLLERWAVMKRRSLFEEVFDVKVSIG